MIIAFFIFFRYSFILMKSKSARRPKLDYTDEKYWIKLINQSLIRFYILRALKDQDLHGYMLIREISKISNEFCNPSESTLYPALGQLLRGGLLQQTNPQDKRRKTYRLTPKGKKAFKTAAKAWNSALPTLNRRTLL